MRTWRVSYYAVRHWTCKSILRIVSLVLVLLVTQASFGQNAIVVENLKPGVERTVWDGLNSAGDASIQGFATDMSVNKGNRIDFKIDVGGSPNKVFSIRVYRLGYYSGYGATLVQDLGNFTGVDQPDGIYETSTRLLDCGNWTVSAHWDVPADAVSGVYVAKLTRQSNGGSSHIIFVVRDDARNADILFKTADATWQAYNNYGPSLYGSSDPGNQMTFNYDRAFKVSYNRPLFTRDARAANNLFNAEFAMIQWLERNGYDVAYSTDVDFDRDPTPLTPANHKVFLSVGHDEYWSLNERNKVENARNAGVHLAFLSGNEAYWKTRWEQSIDGSGTGHRTLVCYKEGTGADMGETTCGSMDCDPLAGTWTGLWRFGEQEDAGRPENTLSGQMSWIERSVPLQVPSKYKNLRFWRNTSVENLSEGQTAVLGSAILGYEWNFEHESFRSTYPKGRVLMSSTTYIGDGTCCGFDEVRDGYSTLDLIAGKKYIHHLTYYKHSSGALVFGAGTINWAWGLDANHDVSQPPVVPAIQQATVNVFAEMGVQPETLQAGLVAATMSADFTAPSVTIQSPVADTRVGQGKEVVISGVASDIGGVIAGVEVSTDGGLTWQVAEITGAYSSNVSWTYRFIPAAVGPIEVQARGFDDSGNMGAAGSGISGSTVLLEGTCPCSIFSPLEAVTSISRAEGNIPLTIGTKFRTSVNGFILGARFYKDPENTGVHTARLYSASGTLLASATFAYESNAGWQSVSFPSPVAVQANTTYVIAYYSEGGKYSVSATGFTSGVTRGPIRALASGEDGGNGVYAYGNVFPDNSFNASNYLVDAIFNTTTACLNTPTIAATGPVCSDAPINLQLNGVSNSAPYTLMLNELPVGSVNAGQTFTAPHLVANPASMINVSIWPSGAGGSASSETEPTELGLKFRSSMPGYISAVRFFKTVEAGTGTFSVRLYDLENPGVVMGFGSVNITNPEASGWQIALLTNPVLIAANKTYVVSYVAPNGQFAQSPGTMSIATVNGPLTALASTESEPNGVFKTGIGLEAPSSEAYPGAAMNYWVDVVFTAINQVRFTQIVDNWGVTCFNTAPNLSTLNLTPVNCAFLPVSLTDFKLSVQANNVLLQWSTASESNNKGFDIQRSLDGQQWKSLDFVSGAINSQTVRRYSYTDREVPAGRYFYRLRQVDLDGKSSLSKVLQATVSGTEGRYALEQNYPNPSLGSTTITYAIPVKDKVIITLYDMQGREIRQLVNETQTAGVHTVTLSTRDLGKGVYHYKMTSGQFQEVRRLLVN